MGRTRKHVKNPIILTLKSKFKVRECTRHIVSWWYAKYGKPMSNHKKLWAGHESAQADRQTDGHSESYIPPWTGGIIIRNLKDPEGVTRNRSPEKERRQYRSPSPSRSESSCKCFRCGKMGHYTRNCPKPRSPSPTSHSLLSLKQSLNFQQMKK